MFWFYSYGVNHFLPMIHLLKQLLHAYTDVTEARSCPINHLTQ